MRSKLGNLMAEVEVSLVETVARLEQAERALLYVGVLDLERRMQTLHDALALVAETCVERVSRPDEHPGTRPWRTYG